MNLFFKSYNILFLSDLQSNIQKKQPPITDLQSNIIKSSNDFLPLK